MEQFKSGLLHFVTRIRDRRYVAVDTERGIVFLPLTSPATDYYGGDRKGANLFGDALVALDGATGKRLWHFQTTHHDLQDLDPNAAPILTTIRQNGPLAGKLLAETLIGHLETGALANVSNPAELVVRESA